MVNRRASVSKARSKQIEEKSGFYEECSIDSVGKATDEMDDNVDELSKEVKCDQEDTTELESRKRGRTSLRTSNRVLKKVKKDVSPPTSPVKKQGSKIKSTTPEGKKSCGGRKWELWSKGDQELFFCGLNEYGKDFDAIHRFISLRQKKRGCPPAELKNKDQIRHYYYRAWHKISKWITFKDGIKKSMQEVYALINYGEFRKRHSGALTRKFGEKLNELFHTGAIQLKVKGKSHKVRTPVCRALKKINRIEDTKKDHEDIPKLPKEIVVELRPRTNKDWAYVHSLSQNPRLRLHMKPDRRLSSVFRYVRKKWRPHIDHVREAADLEPGPTPRLRLAPIGEITPISMKISAGGKRMDMGLDVVKDNLKELSTDALRKHAERKKKHKLENENGPDDGISSDYPDTADFTEDVQSPELKSPEFTGEPEPPEIAGTCSIEAMEMEDSRSREPMDAECDGKLEQDEVISLGGAFVKTFECSEVENIEITPEELTSLEDKFRSGWTEKDAHEITIAEIYCILNEPEKVYLHYDWLDDVTSSGIDQSKVDKDDERKDCALEVRIGADKDKFAKAMEKLLIVARTQFINLAKLNKQAQLSCVQCTCGARTDGSPSASRMRNNRSPLTPKQCTKRGASPGAAKLAQRRGSGAKSKKELDMGTLAPPSTDSTSVKPTAESEHELPVISPAPTSTGTEFRIPVSVPARVAPAGARMYSGLVANRGPLSAGQGQPDHLRHTMAQSQQFIQQLGSLSKRGLGPLVARNKMRLKPVVRQRTLVPKPATGHRPLVAVTMVPGGEHAQSTCQPAPGGAGFMPILGNVVARHIGPAPIVNTPTPGANSPAAPRVIGLNIDDVTKIVQDMQSTSSSVSMPTSVSVPDTVDVKLTSTSMTSPTSSTDDVNQCSISKLLDISLPPPDQGAAQETENLIDIALNNNPTFSQYLSEQASLNAPVIDTTTLPAGCSTPAQSPIKIPDFLLNAESGDISLGSILDSPIKRDVALNTSVIAMFSENSRDSISNKFESQVDTTLQCLMNENSVDYVSKFADLAAQIAASADNDNSQNDNHVT